MKLQEQSFIYFVDILKGPFSYWAKETQVAFCDVLGAALLETGTAPCSNCFKQKDREEETFVTTVRYLFNELCTQMRGPG